MQVQVLHPATKNPRPALYLLDGVDAPADTSNWTDKTDLINFVAGKNVNVVIPLGGTGSYYTNWEKTDPVLGVNQWETFLTVELPPIINSIFSGNGRDVVAGLSMGGQAALTLAVRHPDLYSGVAAYSACPNNSELNTKRAVRATVASKGGNATNMWGPDDDPQWVAHDPTSHAEELRGKTIYISAGSGLPGPYELRSGNQWGTTVTEGGPLEVAARLCSERFHAVLFQLKIPATYNFRAYGTHSWPYWQDDFHNSWPTLEKALGI